MTRRRSLITVLAVAVLTLCSVAAFTTLSGKRLGPGAVRGISAMTRVDCLLRSPGGNPMTRTRFDFGAERVDVLGDSYSVGDTLAHPATQTWDVLLAEHEHWNLQVRGIGGTGFVSAGACGHEAYDARVRQVLADDPALVIVQGGLNDVGHGGVAAAARSLLASFPAHLPVIVLGPAAAPARSLAGERAVDRSLSAAVGDTPGRRYVSALDWKLTYSAGRLHLDAAGNRVYAAKLAAALDARADP